MFNRFTQVRWNFKSLKRKHCAIGHVPDWEKRHVTFASLPKSEKSSSALVGETVAHSDGVFIELHQALLDALRSTKAVHHEWENPARLPWLR